MTSVQHRRHIAKSVTWRLLATATTVVVAAWVTGDWFVGAEVGFFEFFAKIGLYYGHERAWYRWSHFGVVEGS